MTDLRFGFFTVREYSGPNRCGRALWNCRCACGRFIPNVSTDDLLRGRRISCGQCSRPKTFNIKTARKRARNSYRGICTRSKKIKNEFRDFKHFLECMGLPLPGQNVHRLRHEEGLNIPYGPGHCIWLNERENKGLRKNNVYVYVPEVKKQVIVAEAARKTGIPDATIRSALKRGISPEKVIEYLQKRISDYP